QPLAVRASVARRAAVVDVDDPEPSTRPELRAKREERRRVVGGTAMTPDDERRTLVIRGGVGRVRGWIEECVGGKPSLGRELDRARKREVRRVDRDLRPRLTH